MNSPAAVTDARNPAPLPTTARASRTADSSVFISESVPSRSPGDQVRRHAQETHVRDPNALALEDLSQRPALQQVQVFLVGPVMESERSPERPIDRSRKPMRERQPGVEVERVPAVRRGHEHPFADAT